MKQLTIYSKIGVLALFLAAGMLTFGIAHYELNAAEGDKEKPSKLVEFMVIDTIQSKSIPKSLTGVGGNPLRGEQLMVNRKLGNCVACHKLSLFEKKVKNNPNIYGDMGEIGPSLDGVAARYDEGQLRLLIVDAKLIFADTIMPSFYRIHGLHRVMGSFKDKPVLKAQDVEDILSYLLILK